MVLDCGLNPGPLALEASTLPLGNEVVLIGHDFIVTEMVEGSSFWP